MLNAVYSSRVPPATTLISTSLGWCGKQASKQTYILPIPAALKAKPNKQTKDHTQRPRGKRGGRLQTVSCSYTCGWLSSRAVESQKSKVDHPECRSYLGKQNLRPGFEVMLGSPSISLEQGRAESFSVGHNLRLRDVF